MKDELRACPFCGEPFEFSEIPEPGIEVRHYNKKCHLGQFIGWYKTKDQAIQILNTRPIEDELRAENERVKTILAKLDYEEYIKLIPNEDKPE